MKIKMVDARIVGGRLLKGECEVDDDLAKQLIEQEAAMRADAVGKAQSHAPAAHSTKRKYRTKRSAKEK